MNGAWKRLVGFGVLLLAASWTCLAQNRLTPDETAAGWKLLFDGKTMDGWQDPREMNPPGDAWSIDEECLKSTKNPRITEDLFTRDTFRDFELTFEWRVAKGANSGLKYRIQDHVFLAGQLTQRFEDMVNLSLQHRPHDRPAHGQDYVVGFEYQMIDNGGDNDARTGALHQTAALYDIQGPAQDVTKPVGEFNQSRIVLKGNHVEHWLNGVKVVDTDLDSPEAVAHIAHRWAQGSPVYDDLAKQPRKDCPISLQNHSDVAWFRSIKIRRLP